MARRLHSYLPLPVSTSSLVGGIEFSSSLPIFMLRRALRDDTPLRECNVEQSYRAAGSEKKGQTRKRNDGETNKKIVPVCVSLLPIPLQLHESSLEHVHSPGHQGSVLCALVLLLAAAGGATGVALLI